MTGVRLPAAAAHSRTYRSDLRQQQAADTQARILAAFADQLGRVGTTDINVAEAAAAAGVAVRTVYHYFPDRAARLEGLAGWLSEQMGPVEAPLETPEDLPGYTLAAYRRAKRYEALTRAGMAAGMSMEVRTLRMRAIRTRIRELLAMIGAPAAMTDNAAAVIAVLESSEAGMPLVDLHGLTFEQAGQAAAAAVAAIVKDLRAAAAAPPRKTRPA